MDRATERIGQEIDRERELLRSNLAELEDRVRSVIDWRRQFAGHPVGWLAAAFGGGLLIALMVRRPAASPRTVEYSSSAYSSSPEPTATHGDHRRREVSRAWRTIESALIGFAAAKLKDTLAGILPGFKEQLAHREGDGYQHETHETDEA
jgi:hypothetical protein